MYYIKHVMNMVLQVKFQASCDIYLVIMCSSSTDFVGYLGIFLMVLCIQPPCGCTDFFG
uniref:Uncharacterized protein n=1 Tax=Rhizophora mucronata TaxID=61149 RepID=A0A2P2P9Y2_RHIMU